MSAKIKTNETQILFDKSDKCHVQYLFTQPLRQEKDVIQDQFSKLIKTDLNSEFSFS